MSGPAGFVASTPTGSLRSFAARAMASPLRLALAVGEADAARAEAAWEAVRAEFEAAEQAMSRFREDSEITILNRQAGTGRFVAVSGRLREGLVAADRAHRLTGGRFDPRIVDVLERLGDRGATLRPSTIAHRADARVIRLDRDGRVRVDRPVDLGGIGKGLALRWCARLLRAALPGAPFLLDAGGDLVAAHGDLVAPAGGGVGAVGGGVGAAGGLDGAGWRIGIEDPHGGPSPVAVIAMTDGAVATSSVRIRTYDGGGHHLIDPVSGEPGGEGLLAVTVVGPDPAWAEVASKRYFLAGRSGIGAEARAAGASVWWVPADGGIEMTPAARVRTIWVADEAP